MLSGYIKIVKLLVENGAEVDVTNFEDDTPIHLAAQYRKYLVNKYYLLCRILVQP